MFQRECFRHAFQCSAGWVLRAFTHCGAVTPFAACNVRSADKPPKAITERPGCPAACKRRCLSCTRES